MTSQPHCIDCAVETTVLPDRVLEYLETVTPENDYEHHPWTDADWREVAKAYLADDAGHMDALAIQMLTTGVNEFPVIHVDDGWGFRLLRDGNHRASIAASLGLPLYVRTVCADVRVFPGLKWGEEPVRFARTEEI